MKLLQILQSLIPLIAPTLVVAASVYYLIRMRNTDSILLSVGSFIGLVMTALFTYMPYYAQERAMSVEIMSSYYAIGGVISLIGTVIFAVGLFMMVDRIIRLAAKNNAVNNHF